MCAGSLVMICALVSKSRVNFYYNNNKANSSEKSNNQKFVNHMGGGGRRDDVKKHMSQIIVDNFKYYEYTPIRSVP